MEALFLKFIHLLTAIIIEIAKGLGHNWFTLSLAILTVSVLRAYIDPEKLKKQLLAKPKVSIAGSVAFATLTPLCAAGTLGLIVGLLTTVLPWGPIMAFLTSSPLMSPDGFIMVAGIINFKFAVALATASIIIGLSSGYLTHLIEMKTDFLKNQTRFTDQSNVQITCGCAGSTSNPEQACCDDSQAELSPSKGTMIITFLKSVKWRKIWENIVNIGFKNMLLFFSIFVAVGFIINRFVPTSIIAGLLGAKNVTAVPLAGLIGLPLYITTEASIPLIKALLAQGASQGAMLAFWITGQTTSAWVIAGLAAFMKKRVVSLYIFFVLAGGIISGYLFNLALMFWK